MPGFFEIFIGVCLPLLAVIMLGWLLERIFDFDLRTLVKLNIYVFVPAFIPGNKVDVARALLDGGADPMARSERGGTPLHEAAASGGEEMIRLLLDNGTEPGTKANSGVTALDIARESQNAIAIQLLSEH